MPDSDLGDFITLTNAPAHAFDEAVISELGQQMTAASPRDGRSDLPAAYVYLGQFIAHDLTRLRRGDDEPDSHAVPHASLRLNRTPRFDLDSVYGKGWSDPRCSVDKDTGKLGFSHTIPTSLYAASEDDLPRDESLRAVIPDDRNDENLLLAQLHLQFHKLHNAVVDALPKTPGVHAKVLFEAARSEVIRIYQAVLVHDFLPRLVPQNVLDLFMGASALQLFEVTSPTRKMPVEFSVAAFRFGHSMILPFYPLKRRPNRSLTLAEAFVLTGRKSPAFGGGAGLPSEAVIDWRLMLDLARTPAGFLDPIVVNVPVPVGTGQENRLAVRNLRRGNQVRLPSAQGLISALRADHPALANVLIPLTWDEMTILPPRLRDAVPPSFATEAPLWFYILQEARVRGGGSCLGPLGGAIVAGTILGILRGMPTSIHYQPLQPTISSLSAQPKLLDIIKITQPGGI